MKRKEIKATIAETGVAAMFADTSMTVFDDKSGKELEVDMDLTLATVRGTLIWVSRLFDEDAQREKSIDKNLRRLLELVGASIAHAVDEKSKGREV